MKKMERKEEQSWLFLGRVGERDRSVGEREIGGWEIF
jgi:hypothetical protein